MKQEHFALIGMTSTITAAWVSNNTVSASEIPEVVRSIHRSLETVATQHTGSEKKKPAVPVRRSVQPDYIVCLEDGRKLKLLKRYLRMTYDMSPQQYRAKWKLPPDYPMVAPNYTARRSELAKEIGLGTLPNRRRSPSTSAQ